MEESKVLDSLKRVTIELKGTRERLRAAEESGREPIAIVGMSCRLPGEVDSPQDLWELVAEGRDGIAGFPEDRGWEIDDSANFTREGGFVKDATGFDAPFFGIPTFEAVMLDPQQRMLVEAAWEACEDAGIDPETLRGSSTGIFAGVMYHDYGMGVAEPDEPEGLAPSAVPGSSFITGRVSYALGLAGPAVSVDTACSSSLVAIHTASHALRAGDCSLALAGGVTVLSTPTIFSAMSRLGAYAGDGRCKAFSAAADGAGWAEGVGLVLLERLSDAEANGREVLAVVRGSATNQDGSSNGFTAPNGPAQERVIRAALANAGLTPAEVDAVEGHGTGTELGDPIEAGALLGTYGQGRERPLWLGSIKSNIGHTQAAAGAAAVIKMTQALRHGFLPPTLHADQPSPHVDWSAGSVKLLNEGVAWEPGERPRRAGVSSFGASGTNAHLILEEAPARVGAEPVAETEDDAADGERGEVGIVPLLLSAKDETALRGLAGRLRAHMLAHPEQSEAELARSLVTTRPQLERRAVVSGADREQLLGALAALATDAEDDSAHLAPAPVSSAKTGPVFLFPGQGAQWRSMAIELLDSSPQFARAIDECEQALEPHVEWSLSAILRREPEAPELDLIDIVQPVLFAMSVGLAALWRACGIEPAAVVGHSQGEIAAVHVAGGLSLDDAARLVALRAQILEWGSGRGGMALVGASAEELTARVPDWDKRVALAGVNAPSSIVISGGTSALEEVLARCAEAGLWTHKIRAAAGAGHSPAVEEARPLLLEAAEGISALPGTVPFYSSVEAGPVDTATLDAEYWYRNARQTVRFGPTVNLLLSQGFRNFVEVSPNPIFTLPLNEAFAQELGKAVSEATFTGTLRHHRGALHDFGRAVGAAWAGGVAVDWERVLPPARAVRLPTYPFQRRYFWLATSNEHLAGDPQAAVLPGAPAVPIETLVQRLAALPEEERAEAALEFLRNQLAEVLAFDSAEEVDPESPFVELGFDSLLALQYRGRLNRTIGFELDLRAVLDNPTPAALAGHIAAQVGAGDLPVPGAGGNTLGTLLSNAHGDGRMGEFVGLLGSLAEFRPSFATAEEAGEPFSTRLAEGEAEPLLVLVPSIVPTSGPHEYAKLARGFDGAREAISLRWPGFATGESLPASPEAALELQVAALEQATGDRPYALAGHSTGGAFAYAIAQRMEQRGRPPLAVAMIDSYHPLQTGIDAANGGEVRSIGLELLGQMLSFGDGEIAAAIDDAAITATAHYVGLLAAIETTAIEPPVLLVQAEELVGADPADPEARPRWAVPHDLVEAPGNHLTMMDAHAEATAAAIAGWLEQAVDGAHARQANEGREVHT